MTDADRRKAFNICTSTELGCEDNCPYVELDCSYYECLIANKNFARLEIDRQKAEIDKLKNQIKVGDKIYEDNILKMEAEKDNLKQVIERLQTEVDKWKSALKNGCELSKCINKGWVMNEAYREFAEKFKHTAMAVRKSINDNCTYIVDDEFIDNTLDELTGGSKNG